MNGEGKIENGSVEWLSQAPKVSDALKKGTFVTVSTWSDDVSGLVCDWEGVGILLDESDEDGYLFVPWASVRHVRIEEVAQRRVKSLP
ncbi:MAG: hypothetical protein H0U65_08180 [Rubrobacter sp.]|nr:hypothetical protein [Rubrobacter sp.]